MKRAIAILAGMLCIAFLPGEGAAAAKKTTTVADSTRARSTGAKGQTRKETVRTLDAIRIEGEIDVPQVLFITARDYRRFRDGQGDRYRTTSTGVAKSIPRPARLRMTKAEPE